MATILTICIVGFSFGALIVLAAATPIGQLLEPEAMLLSIILMGASAALFVVCVLAGIAARKAAVSKARRGPRKRIVAKIDRVWITERGRVVSPHETDLEKPGYHVVLMTPDGKTLECDTAASMLQKCIEGSWGWAEAQGDWLGSYTPDPALYAQYSGH